MPHIRRLTVLAFAVSALAACEARPSTAPETVATSASANEALTGLVRVRASQVCMVNDQFMGKDQIPVTFAGKTYYGCCEGCKAKLETLPSARTAFDPVTGQSVDKASAILARDDSGKVLYFESEASFLRYRP